MRQTDPFRQRVAVFLIVPALVFLGLAGRLLYLGSDMEAVAARAGIELEVFHREESADQEAMAFAARPGKVRVPSLLHATFAEAGALAAKQGLLLEGKGDASGTVVRQTPAPGSLVARGTAVQVWLEVKP